MKHVYIFTDLLTNNKQNDMNNNKCVPRERKFCFNYVFSWFKKNRFNFQICPSATFSALFCLCLSFLKHTQYSLL